MNKIILPEDVPSNNQAFVKFSGDDRELRTRLISDEIISSDCDKLVGYSRKPARVKDNDLIFISRKVKAPNDMIIFGWAVAIKHNEKLDKATEEEIKQKSWKGGHSHFIRLNSPMFIDGTLNKGISLYELMEDLKAQSFVSTQNHALAGKGNVNPRRAYMQGSDVELSSEGRAWLTARLQEAFSRHGKIIP